MVACALAPQPIIYGYGTGEEGGILFLPLALLHLFHVDNVDGFVNVPLAR